MLRNAHWLIALKPSDGIISPFCLTFHDTIRRLKYSWQKDKKRVEEILHISKVAYLLKIIRFSPNMSTLYLHNLTSTNGLKINLWFSSLQKLVIDHRLIFLFFLVSFFYTSHLYSACPTIIDDESRATRMKGRVVKQRRE